MILQECLKLLQNRRDLSPEQGRALFDAIFDGKAEPDILGSLLLALRDKGESLAEIQGAVASMRAHMLTLTAPDDAVDIVGTGGDGRSTFNVSTGAAFVVAGAGIPVAKHGNRAASSLSGSSDVLRALGLNLEPEWDLLEKAIHDIGIVFLFAPRHHPAMRHVAQVRRDLGVRTIFNILGPMTNPAHVKRHMIGVYDPKWMRPMADTLLSLGSQSVWIAHGADGLDEMSTTGPSDIVWGRKDKMENITLTPEDVGLPRVTIDDLRGGDAETNALALRAMLEGKKGPLRDIVLLNAAAAIVAAEKAPSLPEALSMAETSIDSGAARHKLDELVALTHAESATWIS